MTNPEIKGSSEHREGEQTFQISLTDAQIHAVRMAIRDQLHSCEKELVGLKSHGLEHPQTAEDYNTILELIGALESVLNTLPE